jgi:hypothetical protein
MQPYSDQYNNHSQGQASSGSQVSPVEVFAQDQFGLYVFKKTEKLTTALYMVTNLLKDSEPLKWAMRDIALDLIGDGLSFAGALRGDRELAGRQLSEAVIRVLSLLEVAVRSQIMSEMNYALIRREFEALSNDVRAQSGTAPSNLILSETFFSVPRTYELPRSLEQSARTEAPSTPADKKPAEQYKGHTSESSTKHSPAAAHQGEPVSKAVTPERKQAGLSAPRIKDKNRQELIVATLKKYKNRKLSIKDFAQVIVGCSEKTIQRELLELVEKGVLKKEGERRWSTYYLNEQA